MRQPMGGFARSFQSGSRLLIEGLVAPRFRIQPQDLS